ncbi:MAG: BsuPI-related putative proteinase inhibitor, partial [Actinomycetota bacterium]|nr:BsuPI-related putative proteinase inhibitor [Actinomycetota bacterium]
AGEVAAGEGVSLDLRHTEPLRSGAPVRWSLVLRNGAGPLDLVFGSAKDGDVVLRQDGAERYRWSAERFFAQVVRTVPVGAGETATFVLEDDALRVAPGRYDLEASLAAGAAVPPLTRTVTVAP